VAFGLLSSHSRLHGSTSYRVPWVYDEEAVDVCRFFTRLKAKLMPYLYETAIYTSNTGIPTMRSMVLEFPEDKNCSYLDKQYMLGDSLLVAPIFREDGIAEFYLPEGTWTNFFTGKEYEGGKWYSEHHDYLSIPLMVKEGSIIALGAKDDAPDYDYADGVELRVYGLADGMTLTKSVYSMAKEEDIILTVSQKEGKVEFDVDAEEGKAFTVRLMNRKVESVEGAKVTLDGEDTIVAF